MQTLLILFMGAMASAAHDAVYARFSQAITATLASLDNNMLDYPASTKADSQGFYGWTGSTGWTSGFFPGLLWQFANHTHDASLMAKAFAWTAGRAVEANDTSTHDVGFMVYGSFGIGLDNCQGAACPLDLSGYPVILAETAASLAQRYNPVVGMTRSWGSISDMTSFQVIVDNLLNLELLFYAAKHTGNATLLAMATSHVLKTGENWIRPDGSTFHLVVFDPIDGHVISRSGTPQGLSVNSTWARGQAWAIYGFTMAFRYTRNPAFLQFALNVSDFWVQNVPSDGVPKWDFLAVPPNDYRDTSAAAIVASAFVELSRLSGQSKYLAVATQIVASLSASPYFADPAQSNAVLTHNAHDCTTDACTIIETDYYFLEALRRLDGEWP